MAFNPHWNHKISPNKKADKNSKNPKNKYGAVRQTYNGFSYDSKREAQYAADLDWMKKAGEVKKWERQHKIELQVNGVHIANYYIDFKVWFSDGRIEYHEVKGAETALWIMKFRIAKAMHPDRKYVVIK